MINLLIFLLIISAGILCIDVFLYFKKKDGPRNYLYSGSNLVDTMAFIGVPVILVILPIAFVILFSSGISISTIFIMWVIQSSIGVFVAIFLKEKVLQTCNDCFNKKRLSHSLWYLFLILMIIIFTTSFFISFIVKNIINITIFNNIFYSTYKESLKEDNE